MKKIVLPYLSLVLIATLSADDVSAGPRSLDEQRSLFLESLKSIESGLFTAYDANKLSLRDYPLYPYLQYKRLSAELDADEEIKHYLDEQGDHPYARSLRGKWLSDLGKRHRWGEFLANYRDTTNTSLQCLYYRAYYRTGQRQKAFDGAKKLWLSGNSRPKECDPLFNAWREDVSFTSAHVWSRFELAMKNNQLGLAGYLKKMMSPGDGARAELWMKAHRDPEAFLDCDPPGISDSRLKGKVYLHGFERWSLNDPFEAITAWHAHKDGLDLTEEKKNRTDQSLALRLAYRKHKQAHHYLSRVEGGDEKVRTWRVRSALTTGNWHWVLDAIGRLSEDEKKESSWRYWSARALAELGSVDEANRIYRVLAKERSYYGFLSADRLSLDYRMNHSPTVVQPAEIERLYQEKPFQVMLEFLYFDMVREAKSEWWHTVQKLPPEKIRAAAKLAQRWGWDQTAIFTIAIAKEWDDLELRFPLAYKDEITAQAKSVGMDPAVMYALVRRESAFDPRAHSPAGARGLMQIMPATGRQVARKLNEKWRGPSALYLPDVSLRYGSHYFKGLLDSFDNNSAMAAAGYNAGPHRVVQWLPGEEAVDSDIWAETIPFTETRKYVAAVLEYAVIYRDKLGLKRIRVSEAAGRVTPSGRIRPSAGNASADGCSG